MVSVGYLFIISSTALVIWTALTVYERRDGKRLFLALTRSQVDSFIVYLDTSIRARYSLVLKRSLKLSWYYSLHTMLKAVMTLLVRSYDRLEQVVIMNRARAKKVRSESRVVQTNHLTEIEKHKLDTALTPKQKKKLRAEKLERD